MQQEIRCKNCIHYNEYILLDVVNKTCPKKRCRRCYCKGKTGCNYDKGCKNFVAYC